MSSYGLLNSASFSNTYTLTNLGGAVSLPTVGATVFEPALIIRPVGGALSSVYITIPAGKYSVSMKCAIESAAANTAINFAQLVIVDSTDILYGAGSSYNKTASGTTANRPSNQLYINDIITITLTTSKTLTMRLNYNITVAAGATISGELGTAGAYPNPRIPCENTVVFTEIL